MVDIKRIFDRQPSRKELLKTGGNFTVKELREFGRLYINDLVPVRLVPDSLLNLAENTWRETENIGHVIESMWTSFYVFRECVNTEFEAPLVKKPDGVWEWPDPTDFEWGDESTKTLALLFGAYGRQKEATVSVVEGNTVHKLSLPSGVVSDEVVSDLVAHPDEHIKYKIPALGEVRMINQQAWQLHALRNWAGGGKLLSAFDDLINQELDTAWAEKYFMDMVNIFKEKTLKMPVVRFAVEKEKAHLPNNLFITEF